MSLTEWAQLWLQTASVNTLGARWTATDGKVESFTIDQTASEQFPTLRPHALEIGFGVEQNGRLSVSASLPASIDGPRTQIPDAVGMAEPQLVFPNYGDHAYAKIALDQRSVEYARGGLDRVDDDLLRNLLWASLWEMVRDCSLSRPITSTSVARSCPARQTTTSSSSSSSAWR